MSKQKTMYILLSIALALIAGGIVYMQQPKFGRSPGKERRARIERSPQYRDGKFHNLHPTPQFTGEGNRLGVLLKMLFEKNERLYPKHPVRTVKTDLRNLPDDDLLVWFGHSSCLIQSNGTRFLIDPVFVSASPVPLFGKPFEGTELYTPEEMPDIDFLLITHEHWDHLDYETVKRLKVGCVVCPLGVGEYFEMWGFQHIVEMDWGNHSTVGDITIHCLPARHFSGRTFRFNQTLWASFMLETPSQRIYLSGDGGYDTHFADIARQFPQIDVAIVENGQYNDDWRHIHLTPQDLPKAINDLNARTVFTMHHSKYALARHPWDEPIETATRLGVATPTIGEVVVLNKKPTSL